MTIEEAAARLAAAQAAEARAKEALAEARKRLSEAQDASRAAWVEHRNLILSVRKHRTYVH